MVGVWVEWWGLRGVAVGDAMGAGRWGLRWAAPTALMGIAATSVLEQIVFSCVAGEIEVASRGAMVEGCGLKVGG